LEKILEPTYGVIVYQEQVMQIVQSIGGFSLGGADLVRRAMGKKIKEEMDRLKGEFAEGGVKKGYKKEHCEELFELIVKFAGYGFNKSHSAAYALITFYTAYLKNYHPTEFMAALLSSELDNTDKIVKYIDEVKRLGIKLLPPNISKSGIEFVTTEIDGEDAIIFGLGAIKGVGAKAIESIIEARESKPFEDISDFVSRIDASKVNRKVFESLIKAGAMDGFEYSRRALLQQIDKIVEAAQNSARAKKMAKNSLFGDSEELTSITIELDNRDEFDDKDILEFEKETLGFYLSGHPLDSYREELEGINYTLSSSLSEIADGQKALFIGKIEGVTTKINKKGFKFGIVHVLDLHGDLEFTVFSEMLEKIENMDKEEPVAFKVQVSRDGQFDRIRVLKIETLKEAKKEKIETKFARKIGKKAIVKISIEQGETIINEIKTIINENFGNRPIEFIITSKLHDVHIQSQLTVSDSGLAKLSELEGVSISE
jgi:DNA polymerase-3 subunit alpha